MQRRRLLQLGFGGAVVLTVAGGGVALMQPGFDGRQLGEGGGNVLTAVARAVLEGSLPVDPSSRRAALSSHLDRMAESIAALPAATRQEISRLLALLASAPGRVVFAGLGAPWESAEIPQIQAALQGMRVSSFALKQQAYHALRDLTNAAFHSDPSTWAALGYPGPRNI